MKDKKFKNVILIFVSFFILISMFYIHNVSGNINYLSSIDNEILYVGGNGTGNYSRIQEAIDNARDGDTIYVYQGTYSENIIVNKSITLIGHDENITKINADCNNPTVSICSDLVNLTGFTITHNNLNNTIAIEVISNSSRIYKNKICDTTIGIKLKDSDENIIDNLTFLNNKVGIKYIKSYFNKFNENLILKNDFGIILINSGNNIISKNNFLNNTMKSIEISNSNENLIRYNIINNCEIGIEIDNSDENILINNEIINHDSGIIILEHSVNDFLGKNNISFNNIGILIYGFQISSINHTIMNNNIKENKIGIDLSNTRDTSIEKNNFIGNLINALFEPRSRCNKWKENYWDRPRILPKLIFGYTTVTNYWIPIPMMNIDFKPSQKKYNINPMAEIQ